MSERAPFLNTAYSAYHHRERPAEDEELSRVGPGTPCGEYLRRFWQPVVLSEHLGDLPKRLRILGEDLVAFRDKSGAVGLLELHCPHRGTSLEFGLVGEKGIRCCYHGWLFDVDGTILETPGEPADSTALVAECHKIFAQDAQPLWQVAQILGKNDRLPEAPQILAAGCAWPDPAQLQVLGRPPAVVVGAVGGAEKRRFRCRCHPVSPFADD